MYRTETHVHTLPVSSCSRLYPEEMIRLYHEAGYDTVFISDHFSKKHFGKLGDAMTFEEKVDLMYESYLKAKREGEKYGMVILFSAELSLCGNHWLLYRADVDFLKLRPDIFDITLEEFREHATAHGVTVIQAHPLRDGKNTPHPEIADGFEVINSSPRHENFDGDVRALALKHGLLMSAGSDAHRECDVGGAAVLSEKRIETVGDYLELLRSGKAVLVRNPRAAV
ncbi:MAG: PHP domain-containing protein [Clostridia bacterium]|nr:PHP domain-containing protein [Clostridia bacterium]